MKHWLLLFLVGFVSVAWAGDQISLDQKIGKMMMVGFQGDHVTDRDPIVQDILHERIGGVILFDYNIQNHSFDKNIKNPKQLESLTKQLQHYAALAAIHHHQTFAPLLVAIDYEGGAVNRLKEQYGFIHTVSAAELGRRPPMVTRFYADRMAHLLSQEHISLDLAPVVDVNLAVNSPAIGALERSFSSRPSVVVSRGAIFSRLFYQNHVLCTYKHFPGYGSAAVNPHTDFVDVTDTWREEELIPYQQLLRKSYACDFVMTAHVVNRKLDPAGYPATLSQRMLTDVLRDQLGFQGVIITDDMQMKAITKRYGLKKALQLAIQAGDNLFIFGNQLEYNPNIASQAITLVKQLVQEGKIDEQKIDESYQKIVTVEQKIKKA